MVASSNLYSVVLAPALVARLEVLRVAAPLSLYALGNLDLLGHPMLALFCSAKAPGRVILQIHDLAQRWRVEGPTIISGFSSPVEHETLVVLLRGPQPVILCPARSLVGMRLKPEYRAPLDAGRLLLLSPFPESVRRADARTAVQRNRFVAALADQVLIAHAEPGSKTARLAEEIAGWRKVVFTLEHPAGAHLHLPIYESSNQVPIRTGGG
jgi:predicted Rossmann fold nucleotide-binding protein DprA/Smf involved in DNA uptake